MNYIEPQIRRRRPDAAEILARSITRPFTALDRKEWTRVAKSAWDIKEINKIWDFNALTDDNIGTCLGLFDGKQLMGGSMGIIKIPPDKVPYLFLHQLAVDEKYQDLGIGHKLVLANYELIRNELSPVVETLKLTSDPFVSRNVNLYLHKSRMHSNEYKPDFFAGIEKDGGKEHKDMPSDRFYYEAHPKSAWVNGAVFPKQQDYETYLESHFEDAVFPFNPEEPVEDKQFAALNHSSKLAFVETSASPSEAKAKWGPDALLWAEQHKKIFTELFEKQGHTAVDYVSLLDASGKERHFIVTVKDFNENDIHCLKDAL